MDKGGGGGLHGGARVLTTTDAGNVTQGQGVPDHQVLPISGAQHTRAFLPVISGIHRPCCVQRVLLLPRPCGAAWAVRCSGCSSYQGLAVRWRGGGGGDDAWIRPLLGSRHFHLSFP